MHPYICTTCGVQYNESDSYPDYCPICTDQRQYIGPNGQEWTTLEKMTTSRKYRNEISWQEEGLYAMKTVPEFGIGQTAYLVQDNGFNVLWDCITFLDEETIQKINELGGIDIIALSHPHYYSTQVEWAKTFQAPVYIHEDDKQWIMRNSECVTLWSGEKVKLADHLMIHRLGGHFKGGAVLDWTAGNEDKGILLTGDIIQVVPDTEWVSFMYSYPNLIPLPAAKVEEIALRVQTLHFDRIYNAFHKVVSKNGNQAIQDSADRYVQALNGTLFDT